MTRQSNGDMIFSDWCEHYNVSNEQKDFLADFMVCYSSALSGDSHSKDKFITIFHQDHPKYKFNIDPNDLNFAEFDSLVQKYIRDGISSEELLYSFYLQGLCTPLAEELLRQANTELSRQYIRKIDYGRCN